MPRFYFAYGSNLSKKQMRERCPVSRPCAPATLQGFRWCIGQRGFATLAAHPQAVTHGALYLISYADECRLDLAEGVSKGCYGKFYMEVEADGQMVQALVYIDPRTVPGTAKRRYIQRCKAGANAWKLPASAIAKMERAKVTDDTEAKVIAL
jgi:hypothetical protein